MSTIDRLLYLFEGGATSPRIRDAARAVLSKILLRLQEPDIFGLIALRESI